MKRRSSPGDVHSAGEVWNGDPFAGEAALFTEGLFVSAERLDDAIGSRGWPASRFEVGAPRVCSWILTLGRNIVRHGAASSL